MKIKVKEKFVDSISGKKIYANKAENTTNGLNIDDSISSLSSTIKTKQNKLTFAGEDNTITAINSSAIKVDLTDYYKKNETSGKDEISTALETKAYAIARVGGEGPLFGENMKFKFAPEGGTNLNLQEYDSSIDAWTDIGVIVTKENKGPNKILKTDNRNVLQWIDPDYYTKSETSAASSISAAIDGKEDKVFVAEYNVTPYADIKAAYDAGKQIICKYQPFPQGNPDQIYYIRSMQYIPYAGFMFGSNTGILGFDFIIVNENNTWNVTHSTVYDKTETSGSEQLADAFNDKQDKLTFAGETNTITAINSSAIGGGTEYTAGTDLNIVDGVIKVNTNGSVEGDYSFVEGFNTSAIGQRSHAEGYGTLASGSDSHAEGYQTKALDSCSHAEGNETTVLGYCSHAEGYQTSAKGEWSHVEGSNTSAVKQGSHSEGTLTLASGVYSHAEGNNTSATDNEAHSEGYGTLAQGKQSHAEGYYTIAGDNYMHAGGKFNKTSADVAFVIGNGTKTAESARSDAFIVDWNGTASATKLATSGITDIEATINSLASVGGYAVVASTASITNPDTKTIYLVKDTTVTGNDQYKEYICTNTATPTYEMIGDTSIDLSNYYTTAQTSAASEISAALTAKQDTLSAGINLKIDNGIIDIKNSGCSADATSIALGKGAEASGYSLCFGRADENKPHIASGEYCINLGWHSSAIGNYSTVLGGNYCLASGDIDPNDGKQYWGPIAQGGKTSAFGHYSHAEGIETIASGQAAHSEGYFTRAIGHVSHSDGLFTSAFAQGSYAHGNRTIASANYTFVIGTRNLNNSAAFVVGNGTSGDTSVDEDDIRSDAFVVDWNGNVSATGDMYTSAGQVVTDVMLTSATNSTTSFVTNGVADLTPLYTYIKSLEDRIAALEAAAVTLPVVNGDNPTVNGDNPII